MEKPKRQLYVASLAPQDFEVLEERRLREGRTRGETLALLLHKVREAEMAQALGERKLEEVTR